MSETRKQEVITALQDIYARFTPTDEETGLTMFGLVSRYNTTGQNIDTDTEDRLIVGGDWVVENCPEPLCNLE